ncbi:cytochrome P450 [Ramaria rubella]|nr:cytochrome P450 [Ramaria rubella]
MSFVSPSPGVPSFSAVFSIQHGEPIQAYAWAGVLLLTALVFYTSLNLRNYDAIPAIGGSNLLLSYSSATRFRKEAQKWMQQGYDKYKTKAFRIPQIGRWHIIVSGDKKVEELRKAPDDILSISTAFSETMQSRYMLGPTIMSNRYHVGIVRGQLTRSLSALFSDIRQEILLSIEENFPLENDWTSVKVYEAILQVVARTSNRIFVGAPLCRDPDYTALNIRHALKVANGARIIAIFPKILKPLAARFLTDVPTSIEKGLGHLRPLIEERQRKIDEYGSDYPDKPLDFLSWLLDEAEGNERKPENIANRILHINFAAIHTSSMSFTHALFHLAAQPEYIQPLREEVESIVAKEGWTKAALTQMRKLDSFFKESQRMNGLGSVSMTRLALQDFTFSDGTLIPKGAMVSAASSTRHHDDEIYGNGDVFDGFRFSEIREQEGLGTTNQLVATNPDYIAFGHGRHACPGRFFVANEMKLMMAHMILTYDIKMENDGVRPENIWSGFTCRPDPTAEVLFKRRQV